VAALFEHPASATAGGPPIRPGRRAARFGRRRRSAAAPAWSPGSRCLRPEPPRPWTASSTGPSPRHTRIRPHGRRSHDPRRRGPVRPRGEGRGPVARPDAVTGRAAGLFPCEQDGVPAPWRDHAEGDQAGARAHRRAAPRVLLERRRDRERRRRRPGVDPPVQPGALGHDGRRGRVPRERPRTVRGGDRRNRRAHLVHRDRLASGRAPGRPNARDLLPERHHVDAGRAGDARRWRVRLLRAGWRLHRMETAGLPFEV
jgi:hypothetical protein